MTEAIKIDNGWDCEENIQDVLDRGYEEGRGDVGAFHDICVISV